MYINIFIKITLYHQKTPVHKKLLLALSFSEPPSSSKKSKKEENKDSSPISLFFYYYHCEILISISYLLSCTHNIEIILFHTNGENGNRYNKNVHFYKSSFYRIFLLYMICFGDIENI